MKLLSALDATFLHLETPEMPMHVGALHLLQLPTGQRGRFVQRLRAHMADRQALSPVLRQRLWQMPLNLSNPTWVDTEVDLQAQIVEIRLPPEARQGDGLVPLRAAVAALHAQPMDRSRPLWKMHVFEGLAPAPGGGRRVALYTQFHHAAVDGQAAVALAQLILDPSPEGRPPEELAAAAARSRRRRAPPGAASLLRAALAAEVQQVGHLVRQLPATAGSVGGVLAGMAGRSLQGSALGQWLIGNVGGPKARALLQPATPGAAPANLTLAPRTRLNHPIGRTRVLATQTLPLPAVKAAAKALQATLNDVVLWLCATALREQLRAHRELPRKSLVAAVPISLRSAGDTRSDNQASMSLVSLGTQLADDAQRLAHIRAATAQMKATVGAMREVLPTDFPSIGLPWLMQAAASLYGRARLAERLPVVANLVISNVPGPPVPLYLAGARMLTDWPTSIVAHGMALNITVQSHNAQLDFGLVADGQAWPELQPLADAIGAALPRLLALTQPKPPSPPRTRIGARARAG